ncbi:hypothetical protein [Microlunatus sp. GCM10028923]|uniref:hypothetical protein n=1 Tax=Microlunatus sp. GCM10028923 TaxID=3273400 RepID=UPI003621AB24
MTGGPRVALISATTAAMRPAEEALITEIPEVEPWHLLDDRLLTDAEANGGVGDELRARMERLIRYAISGGAAAVLLTCSQFGAATAAFHPRSASNGVPVLGSDESAFAEVVALAPRRLLVLASLASAAEDTTCRISQAMAGAGLICEVDARIGEIQAEGDLLGADPNLGDSAGSYDAILLAQYSLAPAASGLRTLGIPVFSGPAAAAAVLRQRLGGRSR